MWPDTFTMGFLPSRSLGLGAVALVFGLLAFTGSGRYRLGVWADLVRGGSDAPSLRSAFVETAPYRFQPRVRRWFGPDTSQVAMALVMPDPAPPSAPWALAKTPILSGTVWSADFLNIHYSRLEAGGIAHDVHQHADEEMLVMISGQAEILGATPSPQVEPGWLTYYASESPHTISAIGTEPATYIVWRWNGADSNSGSPLESRVLDVRELLEDGRARAAAGESVKHPLFDGETRWLGRLYAHLRTLPAGEGIAAHEDDHDAILVLLEGSIETQGETLSAPAVSFNPAFAEHGMFNPGPSVAQYLAVDLTPR